VDVSLRLGNDGMNLPNVLTLSRVPMMFIIVVLLYVHAPAMVLSAWLRDSLLGDRAWTGIATLNFVLFVIAGITDFLDGYLARKRNQVSNYGILMDAVTDKVLLLGIMMALVDLDRIPLVFVLLILGREFLITGMRLVAATKGVVVSADRGGKQKTVTQILAVSAFLLSDVVRYDLASLLSSAGANIWSWLNYAGVALFVLATFFTLSSGVRYFRKYGALVFAS
jgi:CDP-diacylglycerol--glycerol-3-phosphate 3-phosphatidyltransferase